MVNAGQVVSITFQRFVIGIKPETAARIVSLAEIGQLGLSGMRQPELRAVECAETVRRATGKNCWTSKEIPYRFEIIRHGGARLLAFPSSEEF